MIISNDILEKISSGNLTESVKFKLIQKGFASVQNSNEIQYDFGDKFDLPRSFLIELTKNVICNEKFLSLMDKVVILKNGSIEL
jgi:hypothetical protein